MIGLPTTPLCCASTGPCPRYSDLRVGFRARGQGMTGLPTMALCSGSAASCPKVPRFQGLGLSVSYDHCLYRFCSTLDIEQIKSRTRTGPKLPTGFPLIELLPCRCPCPPI